MPSSVNAERDGPLQRLRRDRLRHVRVQAGVPHVATRKPVRAPVDVYAGRVVDGDDIREMVVARVHAQRGVAVQPGQPRPKRKARPENLVALAQEHPVFASVVERHVPQREVPAVRQQQARRPSRAVQHPARDEPVVAPPQVFKLAFPLPVPHDEEVHVGRRAKHRARMQRQRDPVRDDQRTLQLVHAGRDVRDARPAWRGGGIDKGLKARGAVGTRRRADHRRKDDGKDCTCAFHLVSIRILHSPSLSVRRRQFA